MDGTQTVEREECKAGVDSLYRIILSLALGLALVLALAKLTLLPFPVETPLDLLRWFLRWAVVVSADLLFVGMLSSLSFLLVWGVHALPSTSAALVRRQHLLRWLMILVFQAAALYGVASVPLFRMAMVPLTVQLLSFSGGPELMASSVSDFVSTGTCLALLTVPVGLLLLAWWSSGRGGQRVLSIFRSQTIACLLLLLVVQALICRTYIQAAWTDPNRWERRIAVNPHVVLIDSCWEELLKSDHLTLSFDPVDIDTSDFASLPPRGEESDRGIDNPKSRPLNLVVIVLESVGAGYLDLYGGLHVTMPCLSARAECGGMVFDNVYAHAASSPKGLVALSSSVIPRVDWKLITRDCPDFSVPTLPAVLAERGYRSCYLHSGYWSWKRRDEFLLRHGVDTLIDAQTMEGRKVFSWGMSDQQLFEAGIDWVDQQSERPFHLLLWTIETHHPYLAGDNPVDFGVADNELNRYLNAIRNADARIEWFMQELARRGLDESTVVAVTGDHGEVFGQHNQRVHSFGVYQENVRVPLVILPPGEQTGLARESGVVQQVDIPATLLGLLGVPQPDAWQGRDVATHGTRPRAYFFSTGNEVILGLREGEFKYHFHLGEGFEELFDLQNDPHEQVNLAEQHPERCESYRRRVSGLVSYQREYLARHGAP